MRLRPMSLRVRILLSSLICMLAALLIQMTLFNASSSRIISRQTRTINESTLANLGDDVYALFKDVENALISVYDHKDFIRALGSQDVSALQRDFASLAYTMALDSFEPSMRLNALYLYTLSHERICTYRHAQTPIYTYPEDIYDNSMKGSDEGVREIVADNPSTMVVTSYYNAKREQRLIRCILRILENGKTPIGYMVCDLDPKGLVELIRKYRYSEEQALWLQPVGKQALVGEAPAEAETAQIMRTTQEALVRSEAASPNGCALYTRQLRKYDLTIFSLLPLSALNANQSALWNSTLGVFAVLVCVFGTLFLLISRSLTLPLTRMLSTMNRIKLGETSLRLPEMKKDELGVLGSEFNEMLDRIEGLIAREYQTTLQLNDAKYKALQMQVNPHFLYNTLDTMSAIATAKNCPLVSTLCQALSGLFRYSLNMEQPLTQLSDELGHLQNYLFVMNVRMQNSLHFKVELPTELLCANVPRLSLQPLVENAIQHGLRDKRGEKHIVIRAFSEENVIRIVIEDNGVGMSEEKVARVLAFDPSAALGNGLSIGITNINARLKLLFGEQYGLQIDTSPDRGCRVSICIPKEEARHDR